MRDSGDGLSMDAGEHPPPRDTIPAAAHKLLATAQPCFAYFILGRGGFVAGHRLEQCSGNLVR
jgi:hypothetical protein